MKVLQNVIPSAEQLTIIQRNSPGIVVIRGAAGSGKTTTALLRMKALAAAWTSRHRRLNIQRPVEMLVITYNRTLKGYIEELAKQEIAVNNSLNLEIKTFAKWGIDRSGITVNHDKAMHQLDFLTSQFGSQQAFILDEAQYVLGRFGRGDLKAYLDCERRGRGKSPRCERPLREKILKEVILPFLNWKSKNNIKDFNDLAAILSDPNQSLFKYDIIVVDEAQDLSANEVRALLNHLALDYSVTFVLDSAQRIYSKNFIWREVGINLQAGQSFRLSTNYRNTKEIAAFIQPMLLDVDLGGEDGCIPNLDNCNLTGAKPIVIIGRYQLQLEWIINYLHRNVDLSSESVAFLKPKGGNYFDALRVRLNIERLPYIELTRNDEWPEGTENIALSTMHSAKGLEFDYVITLGLNDKVTPHGTEAGDNQLDTLRRLFAMALGRARKGIVIGYKSEEASKLVSYFREQTFEVITL